MATAQELIDGMTREQKNAYRNMFIQLQAQGYPSYEADAVAFKHVFGVERNSFDADFEPSDDDGSKSLFEHVREKEVAVESTKAATAFSADDIHNMSDDEAIKLAAMRGNRNYSRGHFARNFLLRTLEE